jgi:hypothetical protein
VTVYEAGQTFSELPGDRHAVSANASEAAGGVRGGHKRDGTDDPIRELSGEPRPVSDQTPTRWQPRQYREWKRTKQSCGPHPGPLRPLPLRRQPLSGMNAKEGKREVDQRCH